MIEIHLLEKSMVAKDCREEMNARLLAVNALFDGFVDRIAETVQTIVRAELDASFVKEREMSAKLADEIDNGRKTCGNLVDEAERAKAHAALRDPRILPGTKEGQGLIDARALARYLDVSLRLLYRLMAEGALPAPITLGGRSKRWQLEEIMAWIFNGCPSGEKWRPIRAKGLREYYETIRAERRSDGETAARIPHRSEAFN